MLLESADYPAERLQAIIASPGQLLGAAVAQALGVLQPAAAAAPAGGELRRLSSSEWTVQRVGRWLRDTVALPQYEAAFAGEMVCGGAAVALALAPPPLAAFGAIRFLYILNQQFCSRTNQKECALRRSDRVYLARLLY